MDTYYDSTQNPFIPGRVIVMIDKNYVYYDIQPLTHNRIYYGIDIEKTEVLFDSQNISNNKEPLSIANNIEIVLIYLKQKDELSVIDAIEKLQANPYVISAGPDFIRNPLIIPNDPYYKYLWGLQSINAPMAWDHSTGSSEVVVGVVDSGVDYNHPDLHNNLWIDPNSQGLYGYDFYHNTYDPIDETGHGTHVAGTIGAVGNNFIGITGLCWNVKIAAIKIGNNTFSTSGAIQSIDYANKHRIPILNNSWGGRAYCPICRYAIESYNGLYIASAGNFGSDNDIFPIYPASYDISHIISVAATTRRNSLASFSNYGAESVDIAAPGSDILSTALYGEYSYMSGTSMAAPHVAGAAALLKSYIPDVTALEIKNIILSSVDKQSNLSRRILSGGTLNIGKMMEMVM